MTTVIFTHEVEDGERWAKAWKKGPGSRHELFAQLGTVRTFRDPQNPNLTGLLVEVSDMNKMQALLTSEEGRKAMQEDGVKPETLRMCVEFTP